MPDPCAVCGGPHPLHLVFRCRSAKRWRGRNFDAAAAEGAAGAAFMRALGLDPTRDADFARFARDATVASVREPLAENPPERFDPEEGERWSIHVAWRGEATPARVDAVRVEVTKAIEGARNFSVLRVDP